MPLFYYKNIFTLQKIVVDILGRICDNQYRCKHKPLYRRIAMTEVKKVLMERDGMSSAEADKEIADMMQRVSEGENPEEVLYEIGLEPDYIFDILPL